MGMWAAPVEMRQSDIDRTLWLCTLDVPLNMADSSMAGIMHYKYEIVSLNEGRISEGPTERTETKMKRNYFHTFRPNYSHTRFRGSTHILKEVAVEKFIAELLAQLRQRDMTFMWYMDSYRDLMDCIPNVQRGTVENAFDDFLGLPEVLFDLKMIIYLLDALI